MTPCPVVPVPQKHIIFSRWNFYNNMEIIKRRYEKIKRRRYSLKTRSIWTRKKYRTRECEGCRTSRCKYPSTNISIWIHFLCSFLRSNTSNGLKEHAGWEILWARGRNHPGGVLERFPRFLLHQLERALSIYPILRIMMWSRTLVYIPLVLDSVWSEMTNAVCINFEKKNKTFKKQKWRRVDEDVSLSNGFVPDTIHKSNFRGISGMFTRIRLYFRYHGQDSHNVQRYARERFHRKFHNYGTFRTEKVSYGTF